MNPPRTTRGTESRENGERRKPWAPAEKFPNPGEDPDWSYRYVRTHYGGNIEDVSNLAVRQADGYEPVMISEHPELAAKMHLHPGMIKDNQVRFSGQVLCRTTHENAREVADYYHRQSIAQQRSVETDNMSVEGGRNQAGMRFTQAERSTQRSRAI